MQDNGVNDDSGSYVISNSSYTAPDGRGSLTVTRAALGSTAAAHDGTTGIAHYKDCLLYTSPSPRDVEESRMPSSA